MPHKKLRRSARSRIVAGVCGGLAEYFDIDPVAIRVGYVLLSVLSNGFPGVLIYILIWILVPEREYV